MPLCETLAMLVDCVVDGIPTMTAEDQRWANAIRSIVIYRDGKRLDAWESTVNDASPLQKTTPTQEMLGELEMLGMSNLYQAFDPKRTTAFYERLIPYFWDRGIKLPVSPDLSDW